MAIDMEAHIRSVVDQAPPLSAEQINRLRVILWGPLASAPNVDVPLRLSA